MKVKDLLKVLNESDHVVCDFFAYGIFYANSFKDGMIDVRDHLDRLNYDCINAKVIGVHLDPEFLYISATLTK